MMKNYWKNKIIFAFACFFLVACSEDFLDISPTSAQTELTYYRNVSELESGLIACYSNLTNFNSIRGVWAFGNVGADDSEKGGSGPADQADLNDISFSRQNSSNGWVQVEWINQYDLIAKCNKVIDMSEGVTGNENEIERIVNEAKYLRAYAYYNLVTLFGDVPMPIKYLAPDEIVLEKADASVVLNQIEQDLQDATSLPVKSQTQVGRVTSGAAYSLLGKVYLWQKEFGKAAEAYEKIVASGEYELVDDYGFIYRYEGQNNSESIFEFQLARGVDGGNIGNNLSRYRMSRDDGASGWGFDNPTQNLVDAFEPGDPRVIYTVIAIGDVFPTLTDNPYVVENDRSPTGYTNRKAFTPHADRVGVPLGQLDNNWRYSRYGEVLLFYAEALNEIGSLELARFYLNKVRERARNTPVDDPERISSVFDLSYTGELLPDVTTNDQGELREAIYHEQRVELGMEGHRRWILLRTERFKEALEEAKGHIGAVVEPHEWVFPIPQLEIDLADGTLTQNPGY